MQLGCRLFIYLYAYSSRKRGEAVEVWLVFSLRLVRYELKEEGSPVLLCFLPRLGLGG